MKKHNREELENISRKAKQSLFFIFILIVSLVITLIAKS